ncbi:hypothetical protein [Bacillus cereus]|uniref:hypothetical protein n=1 Tax=Bacillus cereus TaxID=1396 RepID=UPI000BEBC440|nr:hypothetical protein [Bacillus cereus]PEC80233.1 hypothetical protein CON08_07535 [Bacillus cereus]PED44844.1 hypothetical protein CON26_10500 [Bacillus cereus]PEE13512.1 hypothetical protein CON52_02330 [Bacillus cereus]PEU51913.1 hypothetical protein CN414_24325 [Bacillus cereus]PEY80574.1 hypothetical protein CN344_02975 [Bacillus cereus]
MLWLLAYLIVGMVYATFDVHSAVRKEIEKDKENANITVVSALITICIFTVIWPVLLTFNIANWFHKKKESASK